MLDGKFLPNQFVNLSTHQRTAYAHTHTHVHTHIHPHSQERSERQAFTSAPRKTRHKRETRHKRPAPDDPWAWPHGLHRLHRPLRLAYRPRLAIWSANAVCVHTKEFARVRAACSLASTVTTGTITTGAITTGTITTRVRAACQPAS